MHDVERWLAERRPAPPSFVAEAVARRAGSRGSVSERLADGALDALAAALDRPEDRDGAWDLLAADALVTYACAAAMDEGPDVLERLAARLVPRMADLLESHP